MSRGRRIAGAIALWVLRRRSPQPDTDDNGETGQELVIERRLPSTPGRELAVAGLLAAAAALFAAFAVAYATGASTQWFGALLGGAMAALSAALIVAGKLVVVQETVAEPRPRVGTPGSGARVDRDLAGIGEGISRRRLLCLTGATAAAGLTAATIVPVLSTAEGKGGGTGSSPWREGTRLVDDQGRPILPADIEVGSFVTAFPQGADPRELGSPVVVCAVDPRQLHPPPGRSGWDVNGVQAFSKICTHAGCAVAMLRYPLYGQAGPGPALVCPCHYSTFDVLHGAAVEFGPAGRPLPQLPLRVADDGSLEAAGAMSGPVGPAWWGMSQT